MGKSWWLRVPACSAVGIGEATLRSKADWLYGQHIYEYGAGSSIAFGIVAFAILDYIYHLPVVANIRTRDAMLSENCRYSSRRGVGSM